jgi:phosphatidylserine/phosphatidylglycerophosphate/cardiolipin synthase-like enzyme
VGWRVLGYLAFVAQPPEWLSRRCPHALLALACALCLILSAPTQARSSVAGSGTHEVYFTPGDDAEGAIVRLVSSARREVLVLAYTFTNRKIADALAAAHQRGVRVQVIADKDQLNRTAAQKVTALIQAGVPVWLDSAHQAQHNKVMVVDRQTVLTGSYNFTVAAQRHNAENLLIVRDNSALAEVYARQWDKLAKQAVRAPR